LLLIGTLIPMFHASPAQCTWTTPIQLTDMTTSVGWNPSISGDGTKIAYESTVNGMGDIFVVNSDGSGEPLRLTYNMGTAYDEYPSISGDGTKIAYQSFSGDFWDDYYPEIFVVNSDGSGRIQLTNNTYIRDIYPSISADGTKIAYISDDWVNPELFVVNSDGSGEPLQLTYNIGNVYDEYPSISGDGSKIAFTSYVDGGRRIFVINSDGTGLTQLTNDTSGSPSISGDGTKIAFFSDGKIFMINSDGTGLMQITNNTTPSGAPIISGDGSKIVYQASGSGYDSSEIYVINSDGSGLTQLTHNTVHDSSPSISADGTKIAYTSTLGTGSKIFVTSETVLPPATVYHNILWYGTTYVISTTTNSTLLDLMFSEVLKRTQFSVYGATGTTGSCNITIPSELMSGNFSIYKDDVPLVENVDYTKSFDGTHYSFNLTYEHTLQSNSIVIFSTTVIPELTSIMLIATLILSTTFIAIVTRKKKSH
jgi:Tol biopolymer transport system component